MSRIVFFSFPAYGHINPTLPVIHELVRRGQDVVYFSTERFRRPVSATGARFFPYERRFPMPQRGAGPFARVSTTLETLLEQTATVLASHLDQVRNLRPTHILFDSFAPWGRIVAQLLGLSSIASVPSILIDGAIESRYGSPEGRRAAEAGLTREWYAEFRSRLIATLRPYRLAAIPEPPALLQSYGDCNLIYTSRRFQPLAGAFDSRRFRFVGPCFQFRPQDPEFPFERLDGRPLVLVALGTVYGARPQLLRRCMEELAEGPWQVVLSAGGVEMPAAPSNFVVRSAVPQVELLRRAAAFVTHGGMNSVQEALYFGVPLAMAPQAADQFWIASRAEELGTGLRIGEAAGAIRRCVGQITTEGRFADAAAQIGASLRSAGGARAAAEEILSFGSATKTCHIAAGRDVPVLVDSIREGPHDTKRRYEPIGVHRTGGAGSAGQAAVRIGGRETCAG